MVAIHEAVIVYGRGDEAEAKIIDEFLSPHFRNQGFSILGEPNPTSILEEFERITPRESNLHEKYSFELNPKRSEPDRLSVRYSYFKRRNVERKYLLDFWVQLDDTRRLFPRLAVFSDPLEKIVREFKPRYWTVLSAEDRIEASGLTLREIREHMRKQLLPAGREYVICLLPAEIETTSGIHGSPSAEDYVGSLASELRRIVEALPTKLPPIPRVSRSE
jgi:hypothetical protein